MVLRGANKFVMDNGGRTIVDIVESNETDLA